ncbi:hypothetical protein ACFJGX_26150 [Hydrogenophaga sp. UC242_50]|uniref:hypothetical protein n=1 Tax=unclassified Hydrogenophaga TaxID=2610897 RepID=UPI0036D2B28F
MKVISSGISRRFWKRLDSWLLSLETLPARQALEDARAYAVFFNALAASQEIGAAGDLIERFDQATSRTALDTFRETEGPGFADSRRSSEESEGEFLCRYTASFQPLWWQWVFYPIRSAKIVRLSKVEVPSKHRVWLAESEEPHLRVLEFGTLAPSEAVTGELRRAIMSLGIPAQHLSKACRSMALSGQGCDLKRRASNPLLARLCRLWRDLFLGVSGLCMAAAIQIMSSDTGGGFMMLVGLLGIAAPTLLAAYLLHEVGPKWLKSDRLLTEVSNAMGKTDTFQVP